MVADTIPFHYIDHKFFTGCIRELYSLHYLKHNRVDLEPKIRATIEQDKLMAALEEKQRSNIASEDAEYDGPPIPFVKELSDCLKRVIFQQQCIEELLKAYRNEGMYPPGNFDLIAAADGSTVGKLGGSQVILSMVAIARGEIGREDASKSSSRVLFLVAFGSDDKTNIEMNFKIFMKDLADVMKNGFDDDDGVRQKINTLLWGGAFACFTYGFNSLQFTQNFDVCFLTMCIFAFCRRLEMVDDFLQNFGHDVGNL